MPPMNSRAGGRSGKPDRFTPERLPSTRLKLGRNHASAWDGLLTDLMRERGYPEDSTPGRAPDLWVDHRDLASGTVTLTPWLGPTSEGSRVRRKSAAAMIDLSEKSLRDGAPMRHVLESFRSAQRSEVGLPARHQRPRWRVT